MTDRLGVALIYDMNACRDPTGVTRHALAQIHGLANHSSIDLKVVSGRINEPDGLTFWDSLAPLPRRKLPLSTRDMLRLWRLVGGPSAERWTGRVDWVYSPAEYFIPVKKAKLAVTSHDILQDVTIGGQKRRQRVGQAFHAADLIVSVSQFNSDRLLETFPSLQDRVELVPNAADDLFFEPATELERAAVRADFGLPNQLPYVLSVASFQPRKNLVRLVRAAGRLPEVAKGDMAIVLLGAGSEPEANAIREAIATLPRPAIVKMPGYRQRSALRAAYAEATALIFASTCESFGIPVVEAMAQGCPVALANNTALPEIGADAGWYFDPVNEDSLAASVREILDNESERERRRQTGRDIAAAYRWGTATELLVRHFVTHT